MLPQAMAGEIFNEISALEVCLSMGLDLNERGLFPK